MKKLLPAFAAFLLAILVSCSPGSDPATPTAKPGAPAQASVAGAKGVYLQSGNASKSVTFGARAVVSADTAALGEISATGAAQTATFTDADGLTVTVNITQACELADGYVLISYTYGDDATTATALLTLASGALTPLAHAPANWSRIFSRGTMAWYSADGGIYSLDLTSGSLSLLSAEAAVYMSSGGYQVDGSALGNTSAWDGDAWVYADLAGNVYAIDEQNSCSIRAQVITAAGVKKDFGFQYEVEDFYNYLPSNSPAGSRHALYDEATGKCFVVAGREIWDGKPEAIGGEKTTGGYVLHLYAVTFDPAASDVLSMAMTAPIAYQVMTDATWLGTTYIGRGYLMGKSVLTIGAHAYKVDATSIIPYDTAAVPFKSGVTNGITYPYWITNWQFAGGEVYAGPTDASAAIDLVDFSSATAAVKTLVTASGITSWSVVGGVLFYTTGAGTYKAAIDTATGTLGTVSAYSGGEVTAITQ